jgi:hypothetical protein
MESADLQELVHQVRNLLQRVANRAEFIETAETVAERAEHKAHLIAHLEEVAAMVARLAPPVVDALSQPPIER